MNVPQLRFGEFTKEWVEKRLGDICDIAGGGTPSKTVNEYWNGNIPWISSSDVSDQSIFDISISRYITEKALQASATKLCPEGTICVVSRVGVGKVALTKCCLCTSQDFANIIKIEENLVFTTYLLSIKMSNVAGQTQGTSIKGITINEIKNAKLYFSTLPEQQKIAEFLSTIDEKINNQQSIVASLEAQKKGFMQKIFSQQLRLKDKNGGEFPKWEENLFSEYIVLYRGSSPRPIQKYLTKKENGVNWIKIGDTKKSKNFIISEVEERITGLGAKKSRHVFDGELILANSMSFGKTYKLALDGYIYDGWFVLRDYENCFNKLYLIQYLNSEYLQKQYMRLSAGGVVQNISSDIVYNTSLQCPSLPEQEKIANFLSSYDEKIDAENQILTHWKTIKKALLQQMFV